MKDISKLVNKLQSGDMTAFDEIFHLTSKSIFFVAYSILKNKEDSEEIVQEVYIKFFQNYLKLDQSKNSFNWLYTVAKNLSLNKLKKSERTTPLKFEENIVAEGQDVFGQVCYSNLLDIALKELSQEEFEIVSLCLIKGFKRREVALIMSKPLPTVTWIYNNALKKLQKQLKGGRYE